MEVLFPFDRSGSASGDSGPTAGRGDDGTGDEVEDVRGGRASSLPPISIPAWAFPTLMSLLPVPYPSPLWPMDRVGSHGGEYRADNARCTICREGLTESITATGDAVPPPWIVVNVVAHQEQQKWKATRPLKRPARYKTGDKKGQAACKHKRARTLFW